MQLRELRLQRSTKLEGLGNMWENDKLVDHTPRRSLRFVIGLQAPTSCFNFAGGSCVNDLTVGGAQSFQ